tara:strand:+ start:6874 stop:7479 length:606 start_codon:yes stop_codon:yes gene_type:complete
MSSCYIKDNIPKLKQIIPDNKVVLLVYAPWCGHCNSFEPEWEKMVKKIEQINKVDGYLSRVNIDNIGELEMDNLNKISGVPSVLMLDHGKESSQYKSARNAEELEKWVREQLTKHNTKKNKSARIQKVKTHHKPSIRRSKRSRNLGSITNDSMLGNFSRMVGGWIYFSKQKDKGVKIKTKSKSALRKSVKKSKRKTKKTSK